MAVIALPLSYSVANGERSPGEVRNKLLAKDITTCIKLLVNYSIKLFVVGENI